MKRIHLIFFCVRCAMAIPASASERPDGPASVSPDRDVPNVVLIYIDDLGYGEIGCYGCKDIPTSNIDQLAAEGVRCTASYITNPPCCPSRCGLMMGQYAQRFGKYIEAPERLMKRTTAKGKRRKLAGSIVAVDDQIGKLMNALKKHGLIANFDFYSTISALAGQPIPEHCTVWIYFPT